MHPLMRPLTPCALLVSALAAALLGEAAEAQITRNPTGVNVNATGPTSVFLTFGNLGGKIPVEASWCGGSRQPPRRSGIGVSPRRSMGDSRSDTIVPCSAGPRSCLRRRLLPHRPHRRPTRSRCAPHLPPSGRRAERARLATRRALGRDDHSRLRGATRLPGRGARRGLAVLLRAQVRGPERRSRRVRHRRPAASPTAVRAPRSRCSTCASNSAPVTPRSPPRSAPRCPRSVPPSSTMAPADSAGDGRSCGREKRCPTMTTCSPRRRCPWSSARRSGGSPSSRGSTSSSRPAAHSPSMALRPLDCRATRRGCTSYCCASRPRMTARATRTSEERAPALGSWRSGGVAGFPMPPLRYYVGETEGVGTASDAFALVSPSDGATIPPTALTFRWTEHPHAAFTRIEIVDGRDELLSEAIVPRGTDVLHRPAAHRAARGRRAVARRGAHGERSRGAAFGVEDAGRALTLRRDARVTPYPGCPRPPTSASMSSIPSSTTSCADSRTATGRGTALPIR